MMTEEEEVFADAKTALDASESVAKILTTSTAVATTKTINTYGKINNNQEIFS